jgi:hypothetical protein
MSSLATVLDAPTGPVTSKDGGRFAQTPYVSVEEALNAIHSGELDQLQADDLRDELRWISTQMRSLEALNARCLAELNRRHSSGRCTDWMCEFLKLTPRQAYGQVRTAGTLSQHDHTFEALRKGAIGVQQARIICRAMEQLPKTSISDPNVESDLVTAAEKMDPYMLSQHWKQVRYQADQEAGVAAEKELHERRWLRLTQTWSGMYEIEGLLDPVTGATLSTALRAIMGRKAADDERRADQRRQDALGEMARHRLDAGDLPERGGEKPHLLLIADLATLRLEPGSRLAQLDWGPLVTGETARRIAEDASVTPVLVDGERKPLHIGRRSRTIPTSVRKALNLRDRGCQGDKSCTMPPDLCTPHHRHVHWVDGGSSDLPNLELRCNFHHGQRHPENARFRRKRAP